MHSCWNDVISVADEAEDGAHIFAYHYLGKDHGKFRKLLYDRHRLIWMDLDTLNEYGSEEYWEMIQEQADFEVQWRRHLRPKGPDAASFLPQPSFSPINATQMWERIRLVNAQHDDLTSVARLLVLFRNTHYRNGIWKDAKGIQFKATKDKHAHHAPYGTTKFTFRLPDGSHYDVKREENRRGFSVTDFEGNVRTFKRRTNIDIHGSIRRGE